MFGAFNQYKLSSAGKHHCFCCPHSHSKSINGAHPIGLLRQFNKVLRTKMCILSMDASPGNESRCQHHIVWCTERSQRAWLISKLNLWRHTVGCWFNTWRPRQKKWAYQAVLYFLDFSLCWNHHLFRNLSVRGHLFYTRRSISRILSYEMESTSEA